MTFRPTLTALLLLCAAPALAQETPVARSFADRGTGIPASLFGTYIEQGRLMLYRSSKYLRDADHQYQPTEFGAGPDVDIRARLRSWSAQLWVGYGVTNWLAVEMEAAYVHARLDRAPGDTFPTGLPREESGIADIEGQFRTRLRTESRRTPELFAYAEVVIPTQTRSVLVGEPDFDIKPGIGFVKGTGVGTVQGRLGLEYNHRESKLDFGEVSLEWIRRFSPAVRTHIILEGGETGALAIWEQIPGILVTLTRRESLKFDSQIGLSSKSPDWVLQGGLMIAFP